MEQRLYVMRATPRGDKPVSGHTLGTLLCCVARTIVTRIFRGQILSYTKQMQANVHGHFLLVDGIEKFQKLPLWLTHLNFVPRLKIEQSKVCGQHYGRYW